MGNENTACIAYAACDNTQFHRSSENLNELHFENLKNLLKLREKLLIERTTYLVVLFEIQKETLKSRGSPEKVRKVKQKQEKLVLKMREERKYLKSFNRIRDILVARKPLRRLSRQTLRLDFSRENQVLAEQNTANSEKLLMPKNLTNFLPNLGQRKELYIDLKNLVIFSFGENTLIKFDNQNNIPSMRVCGIENNQSLLTERLNLQDFERILQEASFGQRVNVICDLEQIVDSREVSYKTRKLLPKEKFTEEYPYENKDISPQEKIVKSYDFLQTFQTMAKKWSRKNRVSGKRLQLAEKDITKGVKTQRGINSDLTSILDTITSANTKNFKHIISLGNLSSHGKLLMDLTLELISENWQVPKEDAELLKSLFYSQNNLSFLEYLQFSICRSDQKGNSIPPQNIHKSSPDKTEEIIINEMYAAEAKWECYGCREGEILQLLIDELINQHVKEIAANIYEDLPASCSKGIF